MNALKHNNGHEPEAHRRLILLAEDHPLNQKVATLLLERMGFSIDVVGDGAAAIEASAHVDYDAILMDCHMPGVDGFEATRRIRDREESTKKHVPIIAVTALAMAGDRERCLAAGMDDYLAKPIDRELLHQKLVYWMNPGTVSAVMDSKKVIQMFDPAFTANGEIKEEALNAAQLYDAYGEEAPDLLSLFSTSSERMLSELKDAIEEGDAARVARLSHEMKGASWAIGANEMARLSVFIEQAAGQQNWRVIHRTFARLTHHFADAKRLIDKELGTLPNASSSESGPVLR